jgi:hypothetical protein
VTTQRERGALPNDQLTDVIYDGLIKDPVGTIETLYAGWDLPITESFRANLNDYLNARHTNRSSGHDYSFADTGLELPTHRANVAHYQARFGVPSEV